MLCIHAESSEERVFVYPSPECSGPQTQLAPLSAGLQTLSAPPEILSAGRQPQPASPKNSFYRRQPQPSTLSADNVYIKIDRILTGYAQKQD
jgi:hypothetical protein